MNINIHCNTISQFKVLRHLQENFFECESLELIENGIRLTDFTGKSADFILYDGKIIINAEDHN